MLIAPLCFQEKQQRYLGLSPHEKVTLNLVSAGAKAQLW